MNGITVITPTGDRPLALGLLRERWMPNQTIVPDQWIIVDDGVKPYENYSTSMLELSRYAEYYRRAPVSDPFRHSIGLNLELALSKVKYDNVIIMEDDDWYSPNYIEKMIGLLEKSELVGMWGTNYYHVKVPGWREMGKETHASLSQTAFKKTFIPNILKCIPGDISVDLRIWKNNKGLLVPGRGSGLHCSMKGMPGRSNAGIGKIESKYTKDIGYKKLKEWCSDAEIYIDLIESGRV